MFFVRKPLLLYLCVLLFMQAAVLLTSWRSIKDGKGDFRNFYADGYLVRTGQAQLLYDYDAQVQLQNQIVTPRTAALPLMVPPFVSLSFAPLSWLAYLPAFFAFSLINFVMVAIAIVCIRPWLPSLLAYSSSLPLLLFFSFPPLGFALAKGQLSLILLAVYCAAFAALQQNRRILAGVILALALMKLQIAVPVALLFFLWKQWRFLAGFLAGGIVLVLASIWTAGSNHLSDIAHSMFPTSAISPSAAIQIKYGIDPTSMTNLYGLSFRLFGGGRLSFIVTIVSSLALFIWAARRKPSFPLAMLVGLLVSYHLYIHDLTILLLPYALLLDRYLPSLRDRHAVDLVPRASGNATERYLLGGAIAAFLLIFPLTIFLIGYGWQSLLAIPTLLAAFAVAALTPIQRDAPAFQQETTPVSRFAGL